MEGLDEALLYLNEYKTKCNFYGNRVIRHEGDQCDVAPNVIFIKNYSIESIKRAWTPRAVIEAAQDLQKWEARMALPPPSPTDWEIRIRLAKEWDRTWKHYVVLNDDGLFKQVEFVPTKLKCVEAGLGIYCVSYLGGKYFMCSIASPHASPWQPKLQCIKDAAQKGVCVKAYLLESVETPGKWFIFSVSI